MNNQNGQGRRPKGTPQRSERPRPAGRVPARRPAQRPPQGGAQGAQRQAPNGAPRRPATPPVRRRAKKHRSPMLTLGIVIAAAAVCVLVTFLVLFILGYRYMEYALINPDDTEVTVKYVGKVDDNGNPYDGTVIYPDKTAKLAKDSSGEDENWYTLAYSNGDVYRGHLKKVLKHGTGVYVYANGDKYSGNFVDDAISGESTDEYQCVYTYANGDVYSGDFLKGKKHGEGKMTFSDGDNNPDNNPYYEGSFEANQRHGNGVERYSDGAVYEGSFSRDLRNGEGVFTYANGDVYSGSFVDGIRQGKGTYTWENKDVYIGDFAGGDMNGEGTYILSTGKKYHGTFKDGQIVVGEGSVIDLTPNS